MSENSVINSLLSEVSYALEPVKEADTVEEVTQLFADLGYELPVGQFFNLLPTELITEIPKLITNLTELINASSDQERIDKAIALGGQIKKVVEEIKELHDNLGNGLPTDFFTKSDIDELPRRLTDYLMVKYLESRSPNVYAILFLVGVIDETELEADAAKYQSKCTLIRVRWENIPDYFTVPKAVADDIYNWSTDFNAEKFIQRLDKVARCLLLPGGIYPQSPTALAALNNPPGTKELRFPLFHSGASPEQYSQFGFFVSGAAANGGKKAGLAMVPYAIGVANMSFNINDKLEVKLETSASIDNGIGMIMRPPLSLEILNNFTSSPASIGSFLLKLGVKPKMGASEEWILFGNPGKTRFSLKGGHTDAFVSKNGAEFDYGIETGVDEIKLVINTEDADGFIGTVLAGLKVEAVAAMTVGYSAKNGVYFKGSGGLEIELPLHFEAGPLKIENLLLGIKVKDGKIPIYSAVDMTLALGPLVAVVQDIGISFDLSFPENGGKLGMADYEIKFKPPTGIGLSVDASVVKGGGFLFLDPDKGEYAGALELSIQNTLQVAAIGIINTKFPDGSTGFSLLIIVSVQFTPGIALGMGFFLSGLGGMLGINRTIHVDSLREGVKNNAIGHIMFPENIVANINTLLPQIKTIFPVQRDQFMIGFMAKITWGVPSLISIEIGLAIEFTNPVRLAILGVLKIVLPTEEAAILRLQINFVGIIDFDNKYLSFDASLYNSRILTFTLEGDMALRLSWGADPVFVMSVGGFHPAFEIPKSLNLPNMKRLTLTILSGNPNLQLTAYFAVTSNTVQFGARIDFLFKVSKFKVVGYLGFDVLFQFSPFKFICHIYAGLEVKIGSTTLLSISLDFQLSGPTPWNARGTASFKILFIKIKVSFNVTWGEEQHVIEPPIAVLPKLMEALTLNKNWAAELPAGKSNLVTLKSLEGLEDELIIQPFGTLKISQLVMPLGFELDKFGNNSLGDIKKADITGFKLGGQSMDLSEAPESFAPSQFKGMSDDDKLKSPSYTRNKGGVSITGDGDLVADYGWNREVKYEVKVSDMDPFPETQEFKVKLDHFRKMARGGAVRRSEMSIENRNRSKLLKNGAVKMGDDKFVMVNHADRSVIDTTSFLGGSKGEAEDQLKSYLKKHPSMKGKVSVVPEYELID